MRWLRDYCASSWSWNRQPRQARSHRSPRGARAHLRPGLVGSVSAPRRCPGEGGRVPLQPGAPVRAAQGQVRGRAEVSDSSRWAACSAAAELRPWRPQLAATPLPPPRPPNPEPPPAGNREERALGVHGPRLLPRPEPSGGSLPSCS